MFHKYWLQPQQRRDINFFANYNVTEAISQGLRNLVLCYFCQFLPLGKNL
jgi:hypothetical protein